MKLESSEVVWTIEAVPDDIRTIEESFEDQEVADVVAMAAERNVWAWCVVTVTAEWKGYKGTSSLGACSYGSQVEFEKDGYCSDLKAEALANLNASLEKQYLVLRSLFV